MEPITEECLVNFQTNAGVVANIQPDGSSNSYKLYLPINGTIISIINNDGKNISFNGGDILKVRDIIVPFDNQKSASLSSQSYQTSLIRVVHILTESVYGSTQPLMPYVYSQSPNPISYIVLKIKNVKNQFGLAVGPRSQVNVNILTRCNKM